MGVSICLHRQRWADTWLVFAASYDPKLRLLNKLQASYWFNYSSNMRSLTHVLMLGMLLFPFLRCLNQRNTAVARTVTMITHKRMTSLSGQAHCSLLCSMFLRFILKWKVLSVLHFAFVVVDFNAELM